MSGRLQPQGLAHVTTAGTNLTSRAKQLLILGTGLRSPQSIVGPQFSDPHIRCLRTPKVFIDHYSLQNKFQAFYNPLLCLHFTNLT